MNIFARPGLAIGFAAFFMCAEGCLHAESIASLDWADMPFHDWAVSLVLLYGAVQSRANWMAGRPYQAVGWALNASLLYMAFEGHLQEFGTSVEDDPWIPEHVLIFLIALMLAIALAGLLTTLRFTTPPGKPASADH